MMFFMNQILLSFTATAIAVYEAYTRLESLFLMPVYAISNVIVPVIAYNYGARKRERIIRFVKIAMLYALAITTVGLLVLLILPKQIMALFNAPEAMLRIGTPVLRIACITFSSVGICSLAVAVFQRRLGYGMVGFPHCGPAFFFALRLVFKTGLY
jgi:Na+-driven multidrug efflux pump